MVFTARHSFGVGVSPVAMSPRCVLRMKSQWVSVPLERTATVSHISHIVRLSAGVDVIGPATQRDIASVVTLHPVREWFIVGNFPGHLMGETIINAVPKSPVAPPVFYKTTTEPRPAAIGVGTVDLRPKSFCPCSPATSKATFSRTESWTVKTIAEKGLSAVRTDCGNGTLFEHRRLVPSVSRPGLFTQRRGTLMSGFYHAVRAL